MRETRSMAMSQAHKDALAQGRRESRAIKVYLEALGQPKRRGRPVTPETLRKKITDLDERIANESNPLRRVDLIQARIEAENALDSAATAADMSRLEAGFVEYAAEYSERKGITYAAWREAGMPAAVLKDAGIKRTRSS